MGEVTVGGVKSVRRFMCLASGVSGQPGSKRGSNWAPLAPFPLNRLADCSADRLGFLDIAKRLVYPCKYVENPEQRWKANPV